MHEAAKPINWSAMRDRLESLRARLEGMELGETAGNSERNRRVLSERQTRYRRSVAYQTETGQEMVLFSRAGTSYGLPITSLSEIRVVEHLTLLPGVSKVIKGVVNLRGRLVTVHDLGSCWGRANLPVGKEMWLLVGAGEAANVGLLADEVAGIRRVPISELHSVPLLMQNQRDCYLGIDDEGTIFLHLDGIIKDKEFYCA